MKDSTLEGIIVSGIALAMVAASATFGFYLPTHKPASCLDKADVQLSTCIENVRIGPTIDACRRLYESMAAICENSGGTGP